MIATTFYDRGSSLTRQHMKQARILYVCAYMLALNKQGGSGCSSRVCLHYHPSQHGSLGDAETVLCTVTDAGGGVG